jgi:hypothetical protein
MNFNLASLSRDGRPSRDGSPPFLAPQMLVNAASTGLLVRLRLLLTIKSTQDVLSWLPEGKIWRIHMVQTFVASLLPVFSADVSSWNQFLVSLSELGFRVVSRGPDSIAFFHEVCVTPSQAMPRVFGTILDVPSLTLLFRRLDGPGISS